MTPLDSANFESGALVRAEPKLKCYDEPAVLEREPSGEVFCCDVPGGRARVVTSASLVEEGAWSEFFAEQCKDGRYYSILERSVQTGFHYRYMVLEDQTGQVLAVQPLFFVYQDMALGMGRRVRDWVARIRQSFPSFLMIRLLMVGCSAGEGHPGLGGNGHRAAALAGLALAVEKFAKQSGAQLIAFKDIPAAYRETLSALKGHGFVRIPSFPNVKLSLDFPDFETFAQNRLSKVTRKGLRRKFRDAGEGAPIEMEVRSDAGPYLEQVHALYRQVYDRSEFRFEKLTCDYFRLLGAEMPDKTRFFFWKREGRLIAFSLCMIHGDTIYDSYLGLEYPLALDLHLYFVTLRDIVEWAIANGFKHYISTPLNYDPKQHLRFLLDPLDLYVRHPSRLLSKVIAPFVKLLEPTQYDPILKRFENVADLRG